MLLQTQGAQLAALQKPESVTLQGEELESELESVEVTLSDSLSLSCFSCSDKLEAMVWASSSASALMPGAPRFESEALEWPREIQDRDCKLSSQYKLSRCWQSWACEDSAKSRGALPGLQP